MSARCSSGCGATTNRSWTGHEPHHEAFAVNRRPGTDADVALVFEDGTADVPVLGQALFGDVHAGHQFHAGDDIGHHLGRKLQHVVQDAVHAQADPQSGGRRVEVDIGGVQLEGAFEQQIDERRRSDDVDQFPQFFLQRLLTSFEICSGHFHTPATGAVESRDSRNSVSDRHQRDVTRRTTKFNGS